MPWQQQSPFFAGISAASGVAKGQADAKLAAQEKERQDTLDRQNAAAAASSMAYQSAQTKSVLDTGARADRAEKTDNTLKGVGLTPPAMPKAAPGKSLTNRQIATYYSGLAGFYQQHGAGDAASTAAGNAEKFGTLADTDEKSVIALRAQAAKELRDQAEIHKWSQEEKTKVQEEADKVIIAAGHDKTSRQNAASHLAGVIQSANIAADTRLQAAGIGASAAMDRTKYTQDREDTRQKRGFTQQDHLVKLKSTTSASKKTTPKLRNLTPEQVMQIGSEARNAIDQKAPRALVVKHIKATYNLTDDQANALIDAPSGDE